MGIHEIMDKLRAGLLTVDEANVMLSSKGYILRDVDGSGKYLLFPL